MEFGPRGRENRAERIRPGLFHRLTPALRDPLVNVDGGELMRTTTPSAFRRLGWAMLLITVDLRWDAGFGFALDLLPDLVGWALILSALRLLDRLHPLVAALQVIGWMAMGIEVAALVVGGLEGLSAVLDGGSAALFACSVWLLCQIVVDVAHALSDAKLSQQATTRRIVFVALAGLATMSPLWAPIMAWSSGLVVLVLLAAYFGAGVLLMLLMFATAKAVDRWRKDLIRMKQGWVQDGEPAGAAAAD